MDLVKIPLHVPSYVRYISEWEDYEFPLGKCIIDKKICGCGYTQYCLTNNSDVILCSPRVSLLENKEEQNPQCYYFKPLQLTKRERLKFKTDQELSSYLYTLQSEKLFEYVSKQRSELKPLKLLVTYDSLPKLLDLLINKIRVSLKFTRIVVDEFQLIFGDSRFKAGVELDFIDYLDKYCKNVIYLSGTPMLDIYIEQLPSFNQLPYYELIWDESKISSINITKISTPNLEKSAIELVLLYKGGFGPTKIVDGVEYKSKEAILFVNNVSMITNVIKSTGLTAEEVNIITSKNPENLKKIKKCGKEFGYGKIPTKGQPHKLITFCTSTAFCGVDMYSDNAKAYVFSSCNLKTMSVDISLELPQIVGRQRLEDNVFRKDITLYYSETIGSFSEDDFLLEIESKKKKTFSQMKIFDLVKSQNQKELIDSHREDIRDWIENNNYRDAYTSISRDSGEFVLNELMMLADIRSWELQNLIYKNDKTIIKVLETVGKINQNTEISDLLEISASLPYFEDRLKLFADFIKDNPYKKDLIPEEYKKYLVLGYESMRSSNYRKKVLEDKLKSKSSKEDLFNNQEFVSKIIEYFDFGGVYTKKEIKTILNKKAAEFGYKDLVLKAVDIEYIYNIRAARVTDKETKKSIMGIRIISFK